MQWGPNELRMRARRVAKRLSRNFRIWDAVSTRGNSLKPRSRYEWHSRLARILGRIAAWSERPTRRPRHRVQRLLDRFYFILLPYYFLLFFVFKLIASHGYEHDKLLIFILFWCLYKYCIWHFLCSSIRANYPYFLISSHSKNKHSLAICVHQNKGCHYEPNDSIDIA